MVLSKHCLLGFVVNNIVLATRRPLPISKNEREKKIIKWNRNCVICAAAEHLLLSTHLRLTLIYLSLLLITKLHRYDEDSERFEAAVNCGSDKKLMLPVSFVSFEKGIMFS